LYHRQQKNLSVLLTLSLTKNEWKLAIYPLSNKGIAWLWAGPGIVPCGYFPMLLYHRFDPIPVLQDLRIPGTEKKQSPLPKHNQYAIHQFAG
jgi:hypothetical protein